MNARSVLILFTFLLALLSSGCLRGPGQSSGGDPLSGGVPGPKGDAEGVAGIYRPGTLDMQFNSTGIVTTHFNSRASFGHGMALQSDGKIILTGWTYTPGVNAPSDFAMARYHADGTPDLSFGQGGKLSTVVPGFYSVAAIGAVVRDGKIIAIGSGYPVQTSAPRSIILARYHSDGTLDTSYGNSGFLITNLVGPSGAYHTYATNVTSQSDGKFVISGGAYRGGSTWDFVVARYHSNGAPDHSFGNQGVISTNVGINNVTGNDFNSGARALAVQSDGKIVATGYSAPAGLVNFQIATVRYQSNGSVDTSFGNQGVTVSAISPFASGANAIALQADGRIVVVGTDDKSLGEYDFALIRYHTNGSIDTSLGPEGGVVRTSIGRADRASGVAIQPDGKIVTAGYTYTPENQAIAMSVVRHHPDGVLDLEFGDSGKASVPMGYVPQNPGTNGSGVTIQADGKIITGGYSFLNGSPDFAIARFHP